MRRSASGSHRRCKSMPVGKASRKNSNGEKPRIDIEFDENDVK